MSGAGFTRQSMDSMLDHSNVA
ncbi:hypothetical protein EMIT0215P_110092 [Pseudomonas serboccidentalis]